MSSDNVFFFSKRVSFEKETTLVENSKRTMVKKTTIGNFKNG